MNTKRLSGKKKALYEALKSNLGNVTAATKAVGVHRTCHYKWMDSDSVYKGLVDDLDEFTLDFVENALFRNIRDGDKASIIFYLKTRGKHRGYVERSEVQSVGDNSVRVEFVEPKKDKKKDDDDVVEGE